MTNYIEELCKNLKKVKKEKPSVVSLFSGCGGLDFTFHKAGYKHIWANDLCHEAQTSSMEIVPKGGLAIPLKVPSN